MDPEAQRVQRTQRVQEQTTVPGTTKFETQCHSISLGCDNRWFRLDINPVVTIASAVIIWALVMVCMIWPDEVCFKYINFLVFSQENVFCIRHGLLCLIITVRNSICGKVMFSQVSVILSVGEMRDKRGGVCGKGACAWGHAWQGGGMHGKKGHALGVMHGRVGHTWQGACMAAGMCDRGFTWQGCVAGGMQGRGCAWGSMHGRGHALQGGCAWQGACMAGVCIARGCVAGGHAWRGGCMVGACVMGGVHGRGACMVGGGIHGRRDGHCSERYASHWNAFLFICIFFFHLLNIRGIFRN